MKFIIVCMLIGLVCTECRAGSLGSFFGSHYGTSGSCEVSEWGAWSTRAISGCSTVTRTRSIIRGRNCNYDLTESEEKCGRPDAFETASAIGTSFLGKFSPEVRDGKFGTASPPPVDLLFVIDKSGSIGPTDFTIVIDHIRELIDLFPVPVGPWQTRIAAISFSSANKVELNFNFFACDSKPDCKARIEQIEYTGGSTHTTKALNKARDEAFTGDEGSRPNAHKVLFLVTDGHSNGGGNVEGAANALKDTGVEIYALGVTDDINEDELKRIVSDPVPDHLYYYDSFNAMSSGTHFLQTIFGVASGGPGDDGPIDGGFFGIGDRDPGYSIGNPVRIGSPVLRQK